MLKGDLDRADTAGGLGSSARLKFPNHYLDLFHERAHIELAKLFMKQGKRDDAIAQLRTAVTIDPYDAVTKAVIDLAQRNDPGAPNLIAQI